MTYKLDSGILEKITSSVLIIELSGEKTEYSSGAEASKALYEKPVRIDAISAEENKVVLKLEEVELPTDPRLFDGV